MQQNKVYTGVSSYGGIHTMAYEGAAYRYKEDLKELLSGKPDMFAAKELILLQMRVAHAIRNNGYAKTARDKYVENVGTIKVKWKTKKAKGKSHARMQDYWDEFESNPNLDGYGTLDTTQSVYHSSMFMSGSSFIRKQIRRDGNTNKIPMKLEPIQSELHHLWYFGEGDIMRDIKYGMEFRDTKPVNYYFRQGLFLENWFNVKDSFKTTEIPANEMLHGFMRELPGQWVGVPFLAASLIPLYEIDELVDATVAKQKAAQGISWIVSNTNPMNPLPIGAMILDKDDPSSVTFKTEGTNVQYLNKGESIQFYQSTDIGENVFTLLRSELRRITNSAGIPYHLVTGDMEGIDFSSLRALMVDFRNSIEHKHYIFTIPLFFQPLTKSFKDLAMLYDPKVADAIPTFQLPRFRGPDDLKDAQADLLEIVSGLSPIEEKWSERNTTQEAIQESIETIKSIGLEGILSNKDSANQGKNIEPNSNSVGY